jgi:O-antigen/teichoic acid export membrane protein
MTLKRLLYQGLLWRGLYLFSVFLLNILFARYYGAAGSSSVYYLVNFYSFVILLSSFSIETGMGYFSALKAVAETRLASLAFRWTMLLSAVSLPLVLFIFSFPALDPGLYRLTALTYIPGQLLISFFTSLFYARHDQVTPNIILASVNGVLILLIPGHGFLPANAPYDVYLDIYFLAVLGQGIGLGIAFVSGAPGMSWSLPDGGQLKKIFSYSLIAFISNVTFFLVYRIDYWFVERYCTPEELGNYIQVSRIGQMLLIIPGIFAGVIFPRTAVAGNEVAAFLVRMSRISTVFFLALFMVVFLTGRWLFPFAFGASFDRMYVPVLIILPGILCLSILTLMSAYFGGSNKPVVNARGAFAGLIIIITGDILFIPVYKIIAAASVSVVGYFTCMIYSLWQFKKTNHTAMGSFFIVKKEDWKWLRQQITKKRNS